MDDNNPPDVQDNQVTGAESAQPVPVVDDGAKTGLKRGMTKAQKVMLGGVGLLGTLGIGIVVAFSGNDTVAIAGSPLSITGVKVAAAGGESAGVLVGSAPVAPSDDGKSRTKAERLYGANVDSFKRVISDQFVIQFSAKGSLQRQISSAEGKKAVEKTLSDAAKVDLTYVSSIAEDLHVFRVEKMAFGKDGDASLNLTARERLVAVTATEIRKVAGVQGIEEDRIVMPSVIPNDSRYAQQWHLKTGAAGYGINAERAWDKTIGSTGVVIAVVDTGVRRHSDLAANLVDGYDFIAEPNRANDGNGRDADPSDPGDWVLTGEAYTPGSPWYGCPAYDSSWHGTHVSGIAAASGNNNEGVSGVSWNAKIQPIRVLGKCGGYLSDVALGVMWAAGVPLAGYPENKTPAKIINMSLGGAGGCSSYMQGAINEARRRGSVVVVSAGNLNQDVATQSPANCSGVIPVAATSKTGNKSYYSNFGNRVAIAAPGGDMSIDGAEGGILSTLNTGAQGPGADWYDFLQGTSMAAPVVSGALAVVMSANPKLTAGDAAQVISRKAAPFPQGSECRPGICGAGLVDLHAAVGEAELMNPDLSMDRLTLPQAIYIPGIPFEVRVNVFNVGTLGTKATTTSIKAFLSQTPDNLQNAVFLSETPLANLDLDPKEVIFGVIKNLVIPKATSDGAYHIVLVVNSGNQIQEASTANNQIASAAVLVETPKLNISVKQVTEQAPTNVLLQIAPTNNKLFALMTRPGWVYTWSFPEGTKVLKQNNFGAYIQLENPVTELPVTVEVKNEAAGYLSTMTAKLTAIPATPYNLQINKRASNAYNRAPLAVSLSPTITGGHPFDRPAGIKWKVGEQEVNKGGAFFVLPEGEHNVEVTLTSRQGKTVTVTDKIVVNPNMIPVCEIATTHVPAKRLFTFIANCVDNDGYVKGIEWFINGIRIGAGKYITRQYVGENIIWDVSINAVDDSGGQGVAATQVAF